MRRSAGLALALVLSGVGCGVQVVTAPPMPKPRIAPVISPGERIAPGEPRATIPPRENPEPTPPNVVPLIAAAREHLNAGRLDAAVQTMESAYQAAPGDAETSRWLCEAYNQRAVARYSDDHLRDAIADLQRSLELDPSQHEIRTQLTRAQSRLRRLSTIEGESGRD
jgi:tetratricopeptide (TPR) repeat protein